MEATYEDQHMPGSSNIVREVVLEALGSLGAHLGSRSFLPEGIATESYQPKIQEEPRHVAPTKGGM